MSQPQAHIHPEAKIGEGVVIEPFTSIYKDVVIGDGTWIGPNVTIMDGARIGKNCRIFPGAVISAVPQDLKFDGEHTTVEIGDNTTIRECVTINRGTKDKHKTAVGNNCLIMSYVHLAHDTIVGNNCIIAGATMIAGHVTIDDHVTIEGKVGVQQFMHIGAYAFIAAATGVRKSVPPYVKAAREPISYAGVNSVGLKRKGFSEEQIRYIEDVYRILYVQNQNISKAVEIVKADMEDCPEKNRILDFIANCDKGIMRGA